MYFLYLRGREMLVSLLVLAFLAVLCVSCGQGQTQDASTEISVKSGSGKIEDEWLEHIGAIVTVVPSNIPIAPIQSMDVVGDKCFVLDLFKRVFCVDMTRKQVILSKVSIGNANNEMLSPVCLTADEEYVYVYDGMKGRILVLTHDLQYHHALNTGCSFGMFRKVRDGFACLSMGQEQNFYFLGNDGIVTFSRKLSDIYPNELSGECLIQIGADGILYVKAYYSNTIYKWENQDLQEAFHFSYDAETHEEEGYKTGSQVTHSGQTYTEGYFVTQSHVLNSFVDSDGKSIHYNLYDRAGRKSASGRLGNVGNVALRPTLQCGKRAYAVMLPDEAAVYGVKGITPDGVVIIRYELPQ